MQIRYLLVTLYFLDNNDNGGSDDSTLSGARNAFLHFTLKKRSYLPSKITDTLFILQQKIEYYHFLLNCKNLLMAGYFPVHPASSTANSALFGSLLVLLHIVIDSTCESCDVQYYCFLRSIRNKTSSQFYNILNIINILSKTN